MPPAGVGPATGPEGPGANPRARLGKMLADLQKAGALPADATDEELNEMARRIGGELLGSARRLSWIATEKSGEQAVDTSLYLLDLVRPQTGSAEFYMGVGPRNRSDADILELLTRRIAGRTLRLRNGIWTDIEYDPGKTDTEEKNEGKKDESIRVVAFSEEYFDLLKDKPCLAPFFAFSNHILVVLDGKAYEVYEES